MRPDISEFSYGYAVTEAFVSGLAGNITAAPAFPSLLQEGRSGGGYDVRIERNGIPTFFQFKLSDCMIRATAYEAQEGLLTTPFYRVHLRPTRTSQQHRLLLALERLGNSVFYVAPMFHLREELNQAYFARTVLTQSIFVRPSDIGDLPDDGPHHIAFKQPGLWYLLSEPVRMEKPVDVESFSRTMQRDLREKGREALTPSSLSRLTHAMLSLLREGNWRWSVSLRDVEAFDDPLRTVAYLSRTFFGCELLIVREQ